MVDVLSRLTAPNLDERLVRLGFRDDDRADVLQTAATVAKSPEHLDCVAQLAEGLLGVVGCIERPFASDPFSSAPEQGGELSMGVLPMLALLVTVDEVQQFHRSLGISEQLSWSAMSDLGQQVYVHRLTYGSFGLHTEGWLCLAWSGALYWLGRLQFNLHREGEQWMLSTHIPRTGPLTPASVEASFEWARRFFAEHFADYPTTGFHCFSWLLDPELAAALPESNIARFQRRWTLFGEGVAADSDAIFFTFARRGDVDLSSLPQETRLQRVIVDRLRTGGHWKSWNGRIPTSAGEENR